MSGNESEELFSDEYPLQTSGSEDDDLFEQEPYKVDMKDLFSSKRLGKRKAQSSEPTTSKRTIQSGKLIVCVIEEERDNWY